MPVAGSGVPRARAAAETDVRIQHRGYRLRRHSGRSGPGTTRPGEGALRRWVPPSTWMRPPPAPCRSRSQRSARPGYDPSPPVAFGLQDQIGRQLAAAVIGLPPLAQVADLRFRRCPELRARVGSRYARHEVNRPLLVEKVKRTDVQDHRADPAAAVPDDALEQRPYIDDAAIGLALLAGQRVDRFAPDLRVLRRPARRSARRRTPWSGRLCRAAGPTCDVPLPAVTPGFNDPVRTGTRPRWSTGGWLIPKPAGRTGRPSLPSGQPRGQEPAVGRRGVDPFRLATLTPYPYEVFLLPGHDHRHVVYGTLTRDYRSRNKPVRSARTG
jgi:hypothetical protein